MCPPVLHDGDVEHFLMISLAPVCFPRACLPKSTAITTFTVGPLCIDFEVLFMA